MDIGVVLQTLLFQGPLTLIGLFGLIVSLLRVSRLGTPAVLTLVASVLIVLTSVGFVVEQFLVMEMRNNQGFVAAASLSSVVGVALSLLRALAVGLLMAAVFAGRPREPLPFD